MMNYSFLDYRIIRYGAAAHSRWQQRCGKEELGRWKRRRCKGKEDDFQSVHFNNRHFDGTFKRFNDRSEVREGGGVAGCWKPRSSSEKVELQVSIVGVVR